MRTVSKNRTALLRQWRINEESRADRAAELRAVTKKRSDALASAGGRHTRDELRHISKQQGHRCLYCNAEFGPDKEATKDHLLPVSYGGGDSALNIVLACRTCNCRRNNTPFLTYRLLLSVGQNQLIDEFLRRRLTALLFIVDHVAESDFQHLVRGLRLHDPENLRRRLLLEASTTARRNQYRNKDIFEHYTERL